MPLAFQCQVGDVFLCMNGGSCISTNISMEESCKCPEGFVSDTVYGHFDNCAMPENALLGIFITFSVAAFICITLLVRVERRLKPWNIRQILRLHVANILMEWSHVMAVYFQNGIFEVGAVFACLNCIGLVFVALGAAAIILGPMFSSDLPRLRKMERDFLLFGLISSGFWIGGYIGIAVTSRNPNQIPFHGFVTFLLVLCIIQIGTLLGLVYATTAELHRHVLQASGSAGSKTRATVETFDRKLRLLKGGLVRVTIIELLPLLPLPAILNVLGSIPFMWVFWTVLVFLNCLIAILLYGFVANSFLGLERCCCTQEWREGKSAEDKPLAAVDVEEDTIDRPVD